MSKFIEVMEQIQGDRTQAELARDMGVSEAAISLAKHGKRQREPEKSFVAALLRAAEPEQQRALLEALGIEDVTEFAEALLASATAAHAPVTGTVGGNGKERDDGI